MVQGIFLSSAILIISLFSVYLSFKLLKAASGNIKIPYISVFFWFKYLIFAYIGSVILNIIPQEYEANLGVYQRKDILFTTWLYTTAGLFFIPLGMFIANLITKYKPNYYTNKFLQNPIIIEKRDKSIIIYILIWVLFLISLFVFFLYLKKINFNIPLLGIFQGLDASKLALLRSEITNNFSGKYYRYALFMKDLPLILLLISYFYKRISFKWKILFMILLFYNIFVSVMDIQKAPLIKLLLLLVLLYFYERNNVDIKKFLKIIFISSILLILMYMFFMGHKDNSILDILALIFHRVFIGSIIALYWIQLYQEQYGYIYGASFPNPAHIFPFEHINITVELQYFVHPELYDLGIVGSAPTVFIADWFINFGPLMALFSMILFGFIIQILDIYFITKLSKRKDILLSVLYIFLIYYFGRYAESSFIGILFDANLIIPSFMMIFIILIRNTLFKRKKIEKNNSPNISSSKV